MIIKAPFCPRCKRLTKTGQYCPACRRKPGIHLSGVIISAYFHEGPTRAAIHEYKYNKVKGLAEDLLPIFASRLEGGFPTGDLVLAPVPLHKNRQAWRGFNQALELAKLLAEAYDIPLLDQLLVRHKNTQPQIELSRAERQKNIKNAFVINKKLDLKNLQKKTILLVDDVMTSGFTLNECAKVLRDAGCRRIWGLVLAKG